MRTLEAATTRATLLAFRATGDKTGPVGTREALPPYSTVHGWTCCGVCGAAGGTHARGDPHRTAAGGIGPLVDCDGASRVGRLDRRRTTGEPGVGGTMGQTNPARQF
jgi:hypothetical protein